MGTAELANTLAMTSTSEGINSDGGVSPRQLPPRPLRSMHVLSPPLPADTETETDEVGPSPTAAAAADTEPFPSMDGRGLDPYSLRADPDAQATVTDFLDFTEYLPSDMVRSLTLIGKLDQTYIDASAGVHELTALWGRLPNAPPASRPAPVKLRADISSKLSQGLSSRVYAHAEAMRMAENVNRHYYRAKTILAKLQTMLENYPAAEQQQQEQQQQKQQQQQQQQREQEQQQQEQQQKQKRGGGPKLKKNGQPGMRRPRVPRITVPGEVLAPYELEYEAYSGESEVSSPTSEDGSPPPVRRTTTPATQPRIKVVKAMAGRPVGQGSAVAGLPYISSTTPKTPKVRAPRVPRLPGEPYISTSSALAKLKPPPENAVIGSADAPWLQLTPYELAKLRKRMKKNAQWTPSETMIARELKALGRNLDAFNEAKKKAEEEGRSFDGALPEAVMEADGIARAPLGALSVDAAMAAEDNHLTNRGMKLNEAKKLKSRWAQLAAQEAEESTRKMVEAARALLLPYPAATSSPAAEPGPARSGSKSARATTPSLTQQQPSTSRKRKRDTLVPGDLADTVEGGEGSVETASANGSASQRQLQKRVKTETPVPIPQPAASTSGSVPPYENLTPAHPPLVRHYSTTPVPAPVLGQPNGQQDQATTGAASKASTSPLSTGTSNLSTAGMFTTTTTVPLKPAAETPVLPPVHKSTTPIHPPTRELRTREAAREAVRKDQQPPQKDQGEETEELGARRASMSRSPSRAVTPAAASNSGAVVPSTEVFSSATATRRPTSRGAGVAGVSSAAGSATEQQQSLAAERPRRASTARNTPAPEMARPSSKRVKRPAPGIVSRTSSGGSAAVGRRKAAPRKKRGSNAAQLRRDKVESGSGSGGQPADGEGEVEVDDDGNVIDPDEARYCVCNRVSFGTMIQCDNVDNCKQEWFHLECVGLTDVPARTTKWYCPDCRVLLNIGERGEVSARGVRM